MFMYNLYKPKTLVKISLGFSNAEICFMTGESFAVITKLQVGISHTAVEVGNHLSLVGHIIFAEP